MRSPRHLDREPAPRMRSPIDIPPGAIPAIETEMFLRDHIPRPASVLEVGAGEGHLTARLRAAGWNVTAIDRSAEAVAAARIEGIDITCAEFLEYQGGPFDIVLFSRVLHHIGLLAGAAFLGAVSDAMLLGHWYLVQPGLPRRLLVDIVRALTFVWPLEVSLLLVPTGMLSVFSGSIDDGWGGILGWFWATCAVTTLALCFVTRAALKERQYSAVMAATGLLYLAILTAFGTDLVARAVLAG